jgi:hypothetical protein
MAWGQSPFYKAVETGTSGAVDTGTSADTSSLIQVRLSRRAPMKSPFFAPVGGNAAIARTGRPTPQLKIGLVAYRDRGDEYITKIVPLTDDLDAIHAQLKTFVAVGGGDTPESVNQASVIRSA